MALIKCVACRKEISENAVACPGCGEKPPKKTSRFTWAILAFILIAIGMRACPSEPVAPAPDTRTTEQIASDVKRARMADSGAIINAERILKMSSKDADSLQFRNEFNSSYGSGGDVVCGAVNGKNGFGGYSGFKRFIVQSGISMIDNHNEKSFESAWDKFCIR